MYYINIDKYCSTNQIGYNNSKGNQIGYRVMLYIKELRESTGLSQNEFAKMFHIPVSTLRKWEQNESTPPEYVVRFIESSLPCNKKEYQCFFGYDERKYYLDKKNNRVADSLGNWIVFNEDIDGVIEDNIGIYIEKLFKKYYEAVKEFDNDLRYDKIEKIKWR